MKNTKKILIIANAPITRRSIGGGDRNIIETTPYLAKEYEVALITPNVGYHHWHTKPKTVNFIKHPEIILDGKDNKIAITLAYLFRSLNTLLIIPKQKADLIISGTHLFPDIVPPFIFKILGRNYFWVCRAYQLIPAPFNRPGNSLINLFSFFHQRIMFKLMKKADLIITDNYPIIDTLFKLGIAKQKLKYLANGVDIDKIKKYRPQKKYPIDASFIGRLDPDKGIFNLSRIWTLINQKLPKARLAVVGYGPEKTTQSLKKMFDQTALNQNILFTGFLPYQKGDEMPFLDLLFSSKVVILPESEGGIPLTIFDALACCVPVVAFKRPELTSLKLDHLFLIPRGNDFLFAQKVIQILSRSAPFPRKNIPSSLNKYSWKNISRDYINYLNGLYEKES